MNRTLKMILSAIIAGSAILSLAACDTAVSSSNPGNGEPENPTADTPKAAQLSAADSEKINYGINCFTAELFKSEYEKRADKSDNVFLSPLSVYTALSVLDNGAGGETQSELNALLGGIYPDGKSGGTPIEIDNLNAYFKEYMNGLGGENTKLNMANSVWVMKRDDIKLNNVFKNNVSEFYSADIFNEKADTAVESINNWVSDKTDEMINGILDDGDVLANNVAILLNAVAFDGKWEKEYEEDSVLDDVFQNYDGSVCNTDFMYSTEDCYFSDDNAKGFIKNYQGDGDKQYSFVAILPNEDVGIDKYVTEYFDENTICDYAENAKSVDVQTSLPKFSFDTEYKLEGTLSDMGMNTAFDAAAADFTKLAEADDNVFVGKIIHKAFVDVNEKGTKAAAVTAITMYDNAAVAVEEEVYEVYLDRPFVFAIYDKQEKVPVFIGTVCDLNT